MNPAAIPDVVARCHAGGLPVIPSPAVIAAADWPAVTAAARRLTRSLET